MEGGRSTNGRFDPSKQGVAVRDDALVTVDLEQPRVRRADLPSQHSGAATSVSATTAATAATTPSMRTDDSPMLLLRAGGCGGRGGGGERFNEFALLLAALEPCDEL